MQLVAIPGQRAGIELGALVAVAQAAAKGMAAPERAFIDALQKVHLGTGFDLDTLPVPTAASIARELTDPAEARQLIRLMLVTALASGPPCEAQMTIVSDFATSLNVHEPAIGVFRHLAKGHRWRFRLAFLRHTHIRHYIARTYRLSGGALAVIRAVLVFRGTLGENVAEATRYRGLGELPDDSLGHAFFMHCMRGHLPFPGEKGGFPEGGLYHDFTHVLGGYDTTPEGEMQVAAFQAGFTTGDFDFFTWLFSIVLHTTGINLLPFNIPLRPGRIAEGTIAVDVMHALQRGNAVARDLGTDWDYWQEIETPLEDVRKRLTVPPPVASFTADGKPKPGVVLEYGDN